MTCYVYKHTCLNEEDTKKFINSDYIKNDIIKFKIGEQLEYTLGEGEESMRIVTHVIQGEPLKNEMYGKCKATVNGKEIEILRVNRINTVGRPPIEEFFELLQLGKPTSNLIV